jgi:hypothetical protein
MTLASFPPEALDALALRLLDVAAMVRKMAVSSRENEVGDFQLHGNKVHEWLGHLEQWAHEGDGKLQTSLIRQRGVRRAQVPAASTAVARSSPPPARRK